MTPSVTERNVYKSLGSFLLGVMASGSEVVQGQVNRVPEVKSPNFAVMNNAMRQRIETNQDVDTDVLFTASIAGTLMSVTGVIRGTILAGATLMGTGLTASGTTTITALGSGTGGIGTYSVSPSQTMASGSVASGVHAMTSPMHLTIQVEVHGPAAADNTQAILTAFRDSYAAETFESHGLGVVPLYCQEPKQMAFVGGEAQYEDRWIIEMSLQINPTVNAPQAFADRLSTGIVPVDKTYPPH